MSDDLRTKVDIFFVCSGNIPWVKLTPIKQLFYFQYNKIHINVYLLKFHSALPTVLRLFFFFNQPLPPCPFIISQGNRKLPQLTKPLPFVLVETAIVERMRQYC